MTILIADDDRALVHLLTARLQSRGYEVATALDAMQVVMVAQRTPISAILLDVNMPGGTGIDALRKLKSSARTASIPVVVLSANTDANLPDRARSNGAAEFLAKPVDFEELSRLLSRLLHAPPPVIPPVIPLKIPPNQAVRRA